MVIKKRGIFTLILALLLIISAALTLAANELVVDAATGKVGIGTSSPELTLHVVGSGMISNYIFNFEKSQSSGAGEGWWHVATLPTTSGDTGNQLTIRMRGGRYPDESEYNIIMGSRNAFTVSIVRPFSVALKKRDKTASVFKVRGTIVLSLTSRL